MKKDMLRGIVGFGVLLVLYILLVFLMPFLHTATFWISFLFTLVAFGVTIYVFFNALYKQPTAKSKFYGFPITRIAVFYLLFQLFCGFLFMVLSVQVPLWAAFLVCAIALGAVVVGMIGTETVKEHTEALDIKLKKDVALMRSLHSRVNQMALQTNDPALKALAEDFRYSDPVSSDALEEAEMDLMAAVETLETAVLDGDSAAVAVLCRKASAFLAERNRLCKLNKN